MIKDVYGWVFIALHVCDCVRSLNYNFSIELNRKNNSSCVSTNVVRWGHGASIPTGVGGSAAGDGACLFSVSGKLIGKYTGTSCLQ